MADNKFTKKQIVQFLKSIKSRNQFSPEAISKLHQAFAIGCNIAEACYYADIHRATFHRWIKKYPELKDYFKSVRQRLGVKSNENVAKSIESGNVFDSWKYLERRQPKKYAETHKHEHSGSVDHNGTLYPEDQALSEEFSEKLQQNIVKRAREKEKQQTEEKK